MVTAEHTPLRVLPHKTQVRRRAQEQLYSRWVLKVGTSLLHRAEKLFQFQRHQQVFHTLHQVLQRH